MNWRAASEYEMGDGGGDGFISKIMIVKFWYNLFRNAYE